uniref:F-box domain-containing protein n=1 Tax=Steinernema glaseri TaxID=37863 RepID=A0A1I8ABW5_9BILA
MDTLNADQIDYLLGFVPHACIRAIQSAAVDHAVWSEVSREHQHRPLANVSLKWSREHKKARINALKTEEGFVYRRWTRWSNTRNLYLKYLSVCGRDGEKTGLPGFVEGDLQQMLRLASLPTDGRSAYLQLLFIDEQCGDLMDILMPRLNYKFNRINIDTVTGHKKHVDNYLKKLAAERSVKKLEVRNTDLSTDTFDIFLDFFNQPNVEILKIIACTPEPTLEFFVQLAECWKRSENCSELIKYCSFDVSDDDIFVHLCDMYPTRNVARRGRTLLIENDFDSTLQLKVKELSSGIMEISVALHRPAPMNRLRNEVSAKKSRSQ